MIDREVFTLDYKKQESISTEELSSLIFKILKRNFSNLDLYTSHPRGSLESIKAFDMLWGNGRPQEIISPTFGRKFAQAVQKLRDNGLIMQDPEQRHDADYVILTEKGEATEPEAFLLSAAKFDEIIKFIEDSSGPFDAIAKTYFEESFKAYQSNLLISSAICLGATSERYVLLLSESINKYLKDPAIMRNYSKSIFVKDHILLISENIKQLKKKFPDKGDLFRDLDSKINTIGTYYRLTRNDAGHPESPPKITKEDLGLALNAAKGYFSTIINVINLLK